MPRRRSVRLESADLLGYGGLIPFFASALALWFAPGGFRPQALFVLLIYAATVLSFLGGARWGIEAGRPGAPRAGVLAGSVLPSLAAWAIVVAFPALGPAWRLVGFIVAFGVQGLWDLASASVPPWYRGLRLGLTVGAELALIVALAWALHPH